MVARTRVTDRRKRESYKDYIMLLSAKKGFTPLQAAAFSAQLVLTCSVSLLTHTTISSDGEIRVQDGHHPVLRGSNEVSFIVHVVLQRLCAIERAIKNREEFSNRVNCCCSSVVVLHLEQSELYHHANWERRIFNC